MRFTIPAHQGISGETNCKQIPVQHPEAQLAFHVLPLAKPILQWYIRWDVWHLWRRHLDSGADATLSVLLLVAGVVERRLCSLAMECWDEEWWVVAKNNLSAGITMATLLPGCKTFAAISLNSWVPLSTYGMSGGDPKFSDPKEMFYEILKDPCSLFAE